MPSYNCRHPTCAALVPAPGFCPRHQVQAAAAVAERHRRYDRTRRDMEAKRFYDSARWRRARSVKLAACPWCEECRRAFAVDVHHKIPLADCTPEQRTDQENLMATCKPCHSRIEGRVRAGRRRRGGEGRAP